MESMTSMSPRGSCPLMVYGAAGIPARADLESSVRMRR